MAGRTAVNPQKWVAVRRAIAANRAGIVRRFMAKVRIAPSGCWEWTAAKSAGYGMFGIGRRPYQAHRVAHELFVGPVPDDLDIDHLCRNRACVNPDHLEPCTRAGNVLRGASLPARNAVATRCSAGHPFDARNTYIRPDGDRDCRECKRLAQRRYLARKGVA